MDLSNLECPRYQPFAFDLDDPFSTALKNLSTKFMDMKLPDSTNLSAVDFYFPHEECAESNPSFQQEFMDFDMDDISLIPLQPMERAIEMPAKRTTSSLIDFNGDWLNKIPPLKVSTSALQLAKVEPWDEIFIKWDHPKDIILEAAAVATLPLPFQEPLKHEEIFLYPIPEKNPPKPKPWDLEISMTEEKINFTDSPSFDYLTKIAPTENSNENDTEASQTEDDLQIKTSGQVHSPTGDLTMKEDSQPSKNVSFIYVHMPDAMIEMLEILEREADACFKALVEIDQLPPYILDLKELKSIGDLQPQITRSCLLMLEREMKKTGFRQLVGKSGHHLQSVLQFLLNLHGLNKTIHTLSDYGYQNAYDVLYDFQQKHNRNLKGDFKPILYQLADLKMRQNNTHPKLLEIRQKVLNHLMEDQQHKVWIHLQHRRKEIQSSVSQLLFESGVECATVDPKYLCDDRKRVFLSANMPTHFPMHKLTLVIHYDWPSLLPADVEERLEKTPRCVVLVRRSHSIGNDESDTDESVPSGCQVHTPVSESTKETKSEIEGGSEEDYIEVLADSVGAAQEVPAGKEIEEPRISDKSIQGVAQPSLVISAHMKHLNFVSPQPQSLHVSFIDYSFLGRNASFQPDILIDPLTAVLLVSFQQLSSMEDLRLRIRMISFKCSKCWLIALIDDASQLRQPEIWCPLTGLVTYYRRAGLRRIGFPFELKLRYAFSHSQVTRIVNDILLDAHSDTINFPTLPVFAETRLRLLLQFPFLNALTAEMAVRNSVLTPLISLPSQSTEGVRGLPAEIAKNLADVVDSITNLKQADGSPEITSSFGRLNILHDDSDGRESPGLFHTPKRLKLHTDETSSPTCYPVDYLIKNWD